MQHKASRRIPFNHVRVSAVVSAESEASLWTLRGLSRTDCAGVLPNVRRSSQPSVLKDRQDRHRTAKIIGYQHEFTGRMHFHISRSSPAGRSGVEQGELSIGRTNRESTDGSLVVSAGPVGLVCRIKPCAGAIQSQATRAGAKLINSGW